jgi:hypothetical protein
MLHRAKIDYETSFSIVHRAKRTNHNIAWGWKTLIHTVKNRNYNNNETSFSNVHTANITIIITYEVELQLFIEQNKKS